MSSGSDDGNADVGCGVDDSTRNSIVSINGSMRSNNSGDGGVVRESGPGLGSGSSAGVGFSRPQKRTRRCTSSSTGHHRASASGPLVPPPAPVPSCTRPCQSQPDRLNEEPDPVPSMAPLGQCCKRFSREQSLARVAAENQQEKMVPFPAWTVDTGQWGGRTLGVPEALAVGTDPILNLTPEPEKQVASLQAWMEQSESSLFSASPPASILHSVREVLERDNARLAQEHVQACSESRAHSDTINLSPPVSAVTADARADRQWSLGPTNEWRQSPLISRPSIGQYLLDQAALSIMNGAHENLTCQFRMDTWSSPFTVGYLNVGRRHLVGSLPEVVEVVLRHRPDILFLGDLVTSRDHIGRLKQRLESDLHDEWFVTTNISALPGRPVGIGAIVHCSLANHMTDCVVQSSAAGTVLVSKQDCATAVEGRIQCIKIKSPDSPFTWQFVGVYQHVAKRANRTVRAVVRAALGDLATKAREEGHRVVFLGDFNAAPPGGRWGYSKWSAAVKEDQTMSSWVTMTKLTEVLQQGKPTPTWRPSEGLQSAALDRVFVSHDVLPHLDLSVHWHCPLIVCDHALLVLRLQDSLIGTGFAGACKPSREAAPTSRCRVNLRKWREHTDEWQKCVHEGLRVMQEEWQVNPPDPFEALKQGELLVDSLAQAIAPKRIRRPGETRRAFGFAGNRLLFRELNILTKARSLVLKILSGDTATLHCPHRMTRWTLATRDLHLKVRRSGHTVPAPLEREAGYYFSPATRGLLQAWLESVGVAIAARQAAVRESYAKARYNNLQNLRKKQKEANGVLDKRTIQAALGKCQPRQRMWGVSGKVTLGVKISVTADQQLMVLELLKSLPAAEHIVHIAGNESGLLAWFSGPRQAGDFISHWSSAAYLKERPAIYPLQPPGRYVAIRPDDMLSVQEWHMSSEGMDTYSVCPRCQATGLHVISTTAHQQRFGNSTRAVKFFCEHCQSVCDEPAIAPMPPCPIPKQVLEAMRKIPAGSPPLINRPIDFETLERCARRQPNNRAPGSDGQPREFSKYGPPAFLELHWKAINAYLQGETPSVCEHEWAGAVAGYIPKKLSALLMSEFRPVACICTKFSLLLSIVAERMDHATEDYGLIDDTQEGFRRNRSTKRQLGKLHSMFAEQRRRKQGLSVVLYLDIKNAFNAVNHRAIFYVFEVKGFPEADITLFRRMYTGSFLVMSNQFGRSAACVLSRGMPQGAPPSPVVFGTTIDPIHSIVRDCKRGCTLQGGIDPTGSSGFADDSPLHTDGPDAVPAMAVMVPKVAEYLEWAGMEVNVPKSPITAMDMKTGKRIATDSITLHGVPFPVIPPSQSHKHLGLRMALNGDFSAEKEHVCQVTRQRLAALAEDRVLSRKEKELVIKTAVCTVFRYSAGFVDWSNTELDYISKLWIRAYKQAWALPGSMDSSPIMLDQSDGGRGCPSALHVWIHEALDVLEQCVSLPGEISRIVMHYLKQQCVAHGCHTLNQLQLLLRVGKADTVLELLLARLDEQGLEISSPWAARDEESIVGVLWPRIHKAWLESQRWTGCTDVIEEVRTEWDQAQLCLKACKKLGGSQPAILSPAQLRGSNTWWMHLEELRSRQCQLTIPEYTALISWLPQAAPRVHRVGDTPVALEASVPATCEVSTTRCDSRGGQIRLEPAPFLAQTTAADPVQCPPCIRGHIIGTLQHDQLLLSSSPPDCLPEVDISKISDPLLLDYLCHGRAVFPYLCNDNDNGALMLECLTPLRQVVSPYPFKQEYVVVRLFAAVADAPLTVLQMALVRDCLLGADRERLKDACARPCWAVARDEYYAGHSYISAGQCSTAPSWKLQSGGSTGQMELAGIVQYVTQRRRSAIPRPVVILHPWQADPPLPSTVTIDISHHLPRGLPAPEGWEIIQRNGRVWITECGSRIVRLDAAHYGMLLAACCGLEELQPPTTQFLVQLSASCRAQQDADRQHYVHWSRHLLANIRRVTDVELVIGASAVMFNPHFLHFVSPFPPDVHLGAAADWPQVPALLVLDSFAPQMRRQVLEQAATHRPGVWVLWQQKNNPDDPGLNILRRTARLFAELPKKSLVLHRTDCWETAAWDVVPSRYITQLWRLDTCPDSLMCGPELSPATVQQHLGCSGHSQYAFHWSTDPIPPRLLLHRQHQQDALRHSWDGLVAGTDGSVDECTEQMGAAYVLGTDPDPTMFFFARVGGPLASARAEAASLLQLLQDVRRRYGHRVHLLIFVDCLVILDILRKWGRSDFHPNPKEIIHFTVIRPLLDELRQWTGNITLLKVKSHTGCLLNERADELAELGRTADGPEICPGPQKYGSFWLRVRPETRRLAEECGKPLPRDSAPNRSLLEKVAVSNTLRAVRKRNTIFVTDLFYHKEGSTVPRLVQRCTPSEYRVWLKCMTGIYPVQGYLKRIGKAQSSSCPHCADGTPESLTHFACVCPKFREARTSAHNQVRDVITSFFDSALGPEWMVLEETRMAKTGLILRSTPQATADQWGKRQPDWVLISQHHQRIAIVDLCRPSDVHPAQLLAAAMRKQQTYGPLQEALGQYTEQGWTVHVFPWVVGIRGLIDPFHIESLLRFLCVQQKQWRTAVERTVLASVQALHFLHRVRFGGLSEPVRPDLESEQSDSADEDGAGLRLAKRKPRQEKADVSHDCTDSDSLEADNLAEETLQPKRARRSSTFHDASTATEVVHTLATTADSNTARQTPSLASRTPRPARARMRGQIAKRKSNQPSTRLTSIKTVTPSVLQPAVPGTTCNSYTRPSPARKRWRSANTADADATGLDHPDPRPTKQHRSVLSNDSQVALWSRWRQLEPRRRKRA